MSSNPLSASHNFSSSVESVEIDLVVFPGKRYPGLAKAIYTIMPVEKKKWTYSGLQWVPGAGTLPFKK
jgi:hypothetical protein